MKRICVCLMILMLVMAWSGCSIPTKVVTTTAPIEIPTTQPQTTVIPTESIIDSTPPQTTEGFESPLPTTGETIPSLSTEPSETQSTEPVELILAGGSLKINVIPGQAVEKQSYGQPPRNLDPFVYDGKSSYGIYDQYITSCEVGKMYVFNRILKKLTEVPLENEIMQSCAFSLDYLYCVTVDGRIFQTDYSFSGFELIYTAQSSYIHHPMVFGDYLYFVEGDFRLGNSKIVLINTTTKTAETVLSGPGIIAAKMLDDDKILWYEDDGIDDNEESISNFYDLSTKENTVLKRFDNYELIECYFDEQYQP